MSATGHPAIIEATAESFINDVMERSKDVPVVVDFWATWCQPCRILGPTLEKLAVEFDGRFVLVKAETEQLPEIAQGFGVRSIPAVFAIKDGNVVDQFTGVLPEPAIRNWLERLMPSPAETLTIEARRIEADDPETAVAKYREALALTPLHAPAKVGLARLLLEQGATDEAAGLIAELERRGFLEPEAEAIKAQLTIQGFSGLQENLEALQQAHQANPLDNAAQLALAEALAAAGQYAESLPLALELVERDRNNTGETARKLMVATFQLLPPDDSLAITFRRKLSFAL